MLTSTNSQYPIITSTVFNNYNDCISRDKKGGIRESQENGKIVDQNNNNSAGVETQSTPKTKVKPTLTHTHIKHLHPS